MRRDISFASGRDTCEGWFYLPDTARDGKRSPVVVMAHGFSGVKEQGLDAFAERFRAAGNAVVVFDFRHFGASGGLPRGQLFPLDMVEDYRNAVSWACTQPEVDPALVGLWGTSFSGGIATHAATVDRRVRAVVANAPSIMNAEARRSADPQRWEAVGALLLADRLARFATGAVNTMPVVAPDGQPCALPGRESFDFFSANDAPTWLNEITVESLEKIREFDPSSLIHMLAPTALLIVAAETDKLIPLDALKSAFDRAIAPKRMVVLPIGHFEIYEEPWLSEAAGEAVAWFGMHLAGHADHAAPAGPEEAAPV